MPKLHEILAAEKTVVGKANAVIKHMTDLFERKTSFLDGQTRIFSPVDDEGEKLPSESEKLRASVSEELNYFSKRFIDMLNIKLAKEATNTLAKADLNFRGSVLATDVPATALLSLETNLKLLRDVFKKLPTRDVKEDWVFDDEHSRYRGVEKISQRTLKNLDWKIVAPATEVHPAQVKEFSTTQVLGTWSTTPTTARISVVEKAALLDNVDSMMIEVKKARIRANQEPIKKLDMGKDIFDAIMGDVIEHDVKVDSDEIKRVEN